MSEYKETCAKHVIVVGGGLVGALEACFMANRGYKVDVYEMRPDIRTLEVVRGRSINLALSVRGREALKRVGLEDIVINEGIPMYARMIHDRDGTHRPIPYGKSNQFIMSVDRRRLNEVLLTEAERFHNVTTYFEYKATDCDLDMGTVTFTRPDGSVVKATADLVIGCDGAYSAIRDKMMRRTLLDYEQKFIPHGYMELCMPPTSDDKFAMEIQYLHIWARDEYMMIALPNKDKTYTVTLFMPFEIFKSLKMGPDVLKFFKDNFPDALPLLGEKYLTETVTSNEALALISVKCSPYHVKDKVVLMGDAAHAMVPFYGQGMNCGFEDCIVFDDMLTKNKDDFGKTLTEFTEVRSVDAKAMSDLALYNYVEMRHHVNTRLFLLRKKVDTILYWLFPNAWMPLYTSVAFSRTRYHQCVKNKEWQDRVIRNALIISIPAVVMTGGYLATRYLNLTSSYERVTELLNKYYPSWV